jgi:hypothetical protein
LDPNGYRRHIEDDADTELMCAIDGRAQIVGAPVKMARRVPRDAVVSAAEVAVKLGDRHHLDDRDAEHEQTSELVEGSTPSALTRERSDVHLVEDLTRAR